MRFSETVDRVGQAVSIRYNNQVYDLQRQGKKVTILSLGEAFFDLPLMPMSELDFPSAYHYSHSRGLPELRTRLSEYFRQHYGAPFDPEKEIIVTVGSKAALHMAFMSVLNPGDEVLIPDPAWVSYPEQVKLCRGKPVGIPYDRPIEEYESYIRKNTKALVLTNPHNPRGYVYTEKELRYFLDLAERHDLWLFSDEAYSDFVADDSFVSLGKLDPDKRRSVVFNSISKNYGISGWRIGYVIANEQLTSRILKVNQHLVTCPATILCQYVAKHFYSILDITKPQIAQLLNKRKHMQEYMDEIGLSYMPGEATFYFFVSIAPSRLSSEDFCTRLLNESLVSTVPGSGYGESCDKFIRVSIGTASDDETREGLRLIRKLIQHTQ